MIWLGAKLVLGRSGIITGSVEAKPEPFWRGVTTGAMINLGNPKAALFFMALFPGFFDVAIMTWIDAVVIIIASAPVGLGSDLTYAWLAARARALLANGPVARRVDLATGGVLVGAGVAIAAV